MTEGLQDSAGGRQPCLWKGLEPALESLLIFSLSTQLTSVLFTESPSSSGLNLLFFPLPYGREKQMFSPFPDLQMLMRWMPEESMLIGADQSPPCRAGFRAWNGSLWPLPYSRGETLIQMGSVKFFKWGCFYVDLTYGKFCSDVSLFVWIMKSHTWMKGSNAA